MTLFRAVGSLYLWKWGLTPTRAHVRGGAAWVATAGLLVMIALLTVGLLHGAVPGYLIALGSVLLGGGLLVEVGTFAMPIRAQTVEPPVRPLSQGLQDSVSMLVSTPGSRVHRYRFDTSVRGVQHVDLGFRPTAIKLITPTPITEPGRIIYESGQLPDEFDFGTGRLVVLGFSGCGIEVEVVPSDLPFVLEVDLYEPLPTRYCLVCDREMLEPDFTDLIHVFMDGAHVEYYGDLERIHTGRKPKYHPEDWTGDTR